MTSEVLIKWASKLAACNDEFSAISDTEGDIESTGDPAFKTANEGGVAPNAPVLDTEMGQTSVSSSTSKAHEARDQHVTVDTLPPR